MRARVVVPQKASRRRAGRSFSRNAAVELSVDADEECGDGEVDAGSDEGCEVEGRSEVDAEQGDVGEAEGEREEGDDRDDGGDGVSGEDVG